MNDSELLQPYRDEIDQADREIVALLKRRYAAVHQIGNIKRQTHQAIFIPERERTVYERLEQYNNAGIPPPILQAIYREIMSGALALEKSITVAFLGPEASYSQLAAIGKFGRSVRYSLQNSIQDVFREVEVGRCDYGCVPVENSNEGVVHCTLDTLLTSPVKICAESHIAVRHNLMAAVDRSEITHIYSHPQGLAQCRGYLQHHFPRAELIETASTTAGVLAAKQDPHGAAIASWLAAETYDMTILDQSIEDTAENTTRFFVIGMQDTRSTGDDKTSLCFGIRDRVGALYDALIALKNNGVSMSMIESRPSKRRNWEYIFYLDLIGHISDPPVQRAIDALHEHALFVRILGAYPRSHGIQLT